MSASEQAVTTFTASQCTNCGAADVKQWCTTYDRLYLTSKQQFSYSKCRNCGCIFLSTGPTESEAYRFYPSNYGPYFAFDTNPASKKTDGPLKQFAYLLSKGSNILFRRLEPHTVDRKTNDFYGKKPHSVLLDFGCGSELFLNAARAKGWEGIGMDFSQQAINQVTTHGHKGILYDSEDSWTKIPDQSVDAVRMNHVIEHLYKPKQILKNLYAKLKEGGGIHISTPNAGSVTSSMYNKFWLGLDCPRHVVIYNPFSLKGILEEVGFRNVEVAHETVTKDIARSIGFKQEDKGEIPHEEIGAKVNDSKLQSILYSPAVLFSVLKRSDRIHAFATK